MENEKRTLTEWIKRYALCVIGLFITALGVAFTRVADLGVSQVSSVANVLSCKFDFFTLGNWLICWNCLLIVLQILILRRKFQIRQLFLQLIFSFMFGYFTDFGVWLFGALKPESYIIKIIVVLAGAAIVAFGIAFNVIAEAVMNCGEAFVKAITDTIHKNFGHIKIAFDVSCVVATVILSLCLFNGQLVGVREGTVIAAVITGFIINFFVRLMKPGLMKFIKGSKA